MKSFYAFLDDREQLVDEEGQVLRDPVARIKSPKVKRTPNDWLRDEEDKRLLATGMTERERVIVYVLRWLGVRTGEAVALRICDIDLDVLRAYVRESKTESGLREIPISDELAFEIRAWLRYLEDRGLNNPNGPLLATRNGTPMAQQSSGVSSNGSHYALDCESSRRTARSLLLSSRARCGRPSDHICSTTRCHSSPFRNCLVTQARRSPSRCTPSFWTRPSRRSSAPS